MKERKRKEKHRVHGRIFQKNHAMRNFWGHRVSTYRTASSDTAKTGKSPLGQAHSRFSLEFKGCAGMDGGGNA